MSDHPSGNALMELIAKSADIDSLTIYRRIKELIEANVI